MCVLGTQEFIVESYQQPGNPENIWKTTPKTWGLQNVVGPWKCEKKKEKKKTSSKSMNGRTPATSINTWPKVHFSSSLRRLFQPETADLASAWWFPTSRWLPALDEEGDVFFQVQPRDRVFGWIGLVICKKCTCKFWWSNMYTCRSKCKSVMYGYIRKA